MRHSPLASPSATREVLAAFGLSQRKRLGQHFLVDDGVVGRILDLARIEDDEVVLEVGPGIGTMTVPLCERAAAVVAVERDERLVPVLEQTTGRCERLRIVTADALRVPAEDLSMESGSPDVLVANLPYEVAATVVLRTFEDLATVGRAVVMVQAEVADRMTAEPSTKEYGAYTVKLALRARTTARFGVSRSVFMPPPRVDSAVVRLDRREPRPDPATLSDASLVATAAFAQRRKTIRNSLGSVLGASAADIERALEEAGVDPGSRAETHVPDAFLAMGRAMRGSGVLP